MKSKKILKAVFSCTVVLSLMLALPVVSFAGSLSRTYSGQFTDNWMDRATTTSSDGAKAYLDYGFNKDFINEDVAYSIYYGDEHRSKIKNGSGTNYGPTAVAREWSNLEVRHSGSSVTYYSIW